MYFLGIILASILAYLIGSISWSIIIVKWRKGIDIRKTGSGNAGATNTVRVLGPFWGFIVAFMDAMKVFLAAFIAFAFSLIPNQMFSETSYFIPALFVLVGHCWPAYYKFKGGKAVACFIGLIAISNIWYFFIFLIIWWTTAGISRKVSLSSLVAALVIAIVIWLPWLNGLNTFTWQWNSYDIWWDQAWSNPWMRFSWMNYLHVASANISGQVKFADGMLEIVIVNFIGGTLLIYRHWSNIIRLKNKVEPDTFPRMTKAEKDQLKRLRKEKMLLKKDQKKELKLLEQINKLEDEGQTIEKELAKLRRLQAKIQKQNEKREKLKK